MRNQLTNQQDDASSNSIASISVTFTMKRYLIITWIILLCTSNTFSQNVTSKRLKKELQAGLAMGFPGFSVAVSDSNGKILKATAGFKNIEKEKRLRGKDRFHIASVTKLFTAVAVLKLVDQRKLKLSDKVSTILDHEYLRRVPHFDQMSVEQLLNHRSGLYAFNNDPEYLSVWIGKNYERGKIWKDRELISFAFRNKPYFLPGEETRYGDLNYVLLKMVVEKKTSQALREFVFNEILNPLKLRQTGYYSKKKSKLERTVTVQGYLKQSEALASFVTLNSSFEAVGDGLFNTTEAVERHDGAAGMVSTVSDLAKFARMLFDGEVLAQESKEFLFAPKNGLGEKVGSTNRGVMRVHRQKNGLLWVSGGDGPAGINVVVAYNPRKDRVIVAYTNIFGLFNEYDFIVEKTIPSILSLD